MRKLSYAVAATLLAFGLAGQAQAVELGFSGALSVQISTLSPVVLPGAGTATVNGSNGAGHLSGVQLPAGVFAVDGFLVPVTDPSGPTLLEERTCLNTLRRGAGRGSSPWERSRSSSR